eukprot:3609727-Rhodomonas_salina.2
MPARNDSKLMPARSWSRGSADALVLEVENCGWAYRELGGDLAVRVPVFLGGRHSAPQVDATQCHSAAHIAHTDRLHHDPHTSSVVKPRNGRSTGREEAGESHGSKSTRSSIERYSTRTPCNTLDNVSADDTPLAPSIRNLHQQGVPRPTQPPHQYPGSATAAADQGEGHRVDVDLELVLALLHACAVALDVRQQRLPHLAHVHRLALPAHAPPCRELAQ